MLRADGDDGVLLEVRVKPRARRRRIAGERAGRLLLEVTEPAIEGRANEAVRRLLADTLQIAPSRVTLQRGTRGRDKLVRIDGLEPGLVRERVNATTEGHPIRRDEA